MTLFTNETYIHFPGISLFSSKIYNNTYEDISKKANFLFDPNNMQDVEKTKIIKYGTNLTGGGFENSMSISSKIKVS